MRVPTTLTPWKDRSTDPTRPRCASRTQDRHKVAEILREAAGEGRLDIDELDERLEATYAAQDVRRPGPDHGRPADPAPGPRRRRHDRSGLAERLPAPRLREHDRHHGRRRAARGVWEVGATAHGVRDDGRGRPRPAGGTFATRETVINANAVMGRHRHRRQRAHPRHRRGHRDHGRLRPGPRQGPAGDRARLARGPGQGRRPDGRGHRHPQGRMRRRKCRNDRLVAGA